MTEQGASLAADIRWAADASIESIADFMAGRLAGSGPHKIAVPGGSTPAPIFNAMREQRVNWPEVTIWLTDDRMVPPDHQASNFGLLQRTLGDSGAKLVPLGEDSKPPAFDLVWLGMGEDGHIASLFPNTDPQTDVEAMIVRITPDPLPPHAPFDRLSLTLPALLNTREIMLVLRGPEKKAVLDAAIANKNDLPIARLLRAARAPVTIFWSNT